MDELLGDLLAKRGFLRRPEIVARGFTDRDITRARRHGLLARVGPGLYVDGALARSWSAPQRHAVTSRAVQHRLGSSVVVSHQSAVVLHRIPHWDLDLREVHVTRRDTGRGRHEAGVAHHLGGLDDADVVDLDGTLVTSAARTVWDLACTADTEHALVVADAALQHGIVTWADLGAIAQRFSHWRGSRRGRLTLMLACHGAESPGESRARYLFWRQGLPCPDLQVEIRDGDGDLVGRSDFGWLEAAHLGEFDGAVKYVDADGIADVRVLMAEKEREDRLRSLGFGMSRLTWHDLAPHRAADTGRRIRADLERSRRLHARGRTVIN